MPEIPDVESASWASSSISASYSDYALTASYISGSILFSGKTDYHHPLWLNNTLSATSSIIQRPDYLLITGSGLSINGINPIFPISSSMVLDVYGGGHFGTHFPVSLWKSGSFPIIFFNAVASGSSTVAGRGSIDHSAANIQYDSVSDALTFNISTVLNYSESQLIPSFDAKFRITPTEIQSYPIVPLQNGLYDLGSVSYQWRTLFTNNISASLITAERLYGTSSVAISASWAPMPDIPDVASASWASQSLSSSYSDFALTSSYGENSKTASYFYGPTGSQAWHIYVEPTLGDLVFDFV
jgi:hypothetical protein